MARYLALVATVLCLATPTFSAHTPIPCDGPQLYGDVPNDNLFCPWIAELWREEISTGCATGPLRYCPDAPVTRAQAAELLGKALHQHVWGQGRPNAQVHGHIVTMFEVLCDGAVAGVYFGLSHTMVVWEGAAAACPAGYWVCAVDERGTSPCDATRPDDVSCDGIHCDNSCFGFAPNDHWGWVADEHPLVGFGRAATEAGSGVQAPGCTRLPVWCCTR